MDAKEVPIIASKKIGLRLFHCHCVLRLEHQLLRQPCLLDISSNHAHHSPILPHNQLGQLASPPFADSTVGESSDDSISRHTTSDTRQLTDHAKDEPIDHPELPSINAAKPIPMKISTAKWQSRTEYVTVGHSYNIQPPAKQSKSAGT